MTKIKAAPGFKRQKNAEGEWERVKTLPGGGRVVQTGDTDFDAYDAQGHYLGFVGRAEIAERMALNGHPNRLEMASDLSLWALWDNAVASGTDILEYAPEGKQFLCLPGCIVMVVREDETGWDVDVIDVGALWALYGNDTKDYLELRIASKPFLLE